MTVMRRVWLDELSAARLVDRSVWSLRLWRRKGIVRTRKYKQSIEYDRDSLLSARESMSWNYVHRRIVPGNGRGRWNSKDQGELW